MSDIKLEYTVTFEYVPFTDSYDALISIRLPKKDQYCHPYLTGQDVICAKVITDSITVLLWHYTNNENEDYMAFRQRIHDCLYEICQELQYRYDYKKERAAAVDVTPVTGVWKLEENYMAFTRRVNDFLSGKQ
jgi:hypothetical protein